MYDPNFGPYDKLYRAKRKTLHAWRGQLFVFFTTAINLLLLKLRKRLAKMILHFIDGFIEIFGRSFDFHDITRNLDVRGAEKDVTLLVMMRLHPDDNVDLVHLMGKFLERFEFFFGVLANGWRKLHSDGTDVDVHIVSDGYGLEPQILYFVLQQNTKFIADLHLDITRKRNHVFRRCPAKVHEKISMHITHLRFADRISL